MVKKIPIVVAYALILLLGFSLISPALAATTEEMIAAAQTSADTGFMLMCSALVLLMTPGLAFFYGGFVRDRNILNTLMMSFLLMGIVGVTWVLWGYSLSFAPGTPFIGGLQWLGLNNVSASMEVTDYLKGSAPEEIVSYSATIPHPHSLTIIKINIIIIIQTSFQPSCHGQS